MVSTSGEKMGKTAYLIRHGLIRSNEEEVYAGRNCEGLTDKGKEQADRIGRQIEGLGIEVIYTSPLQRTVQTAKILNHYCNSKLIEDRDLIELDLGHWTGLSKDQVWAKYPVQYRAWLDNPSQFKEAGIESLESVQERVLSSLNRFLQLRPEKTAAFVTHSVAVKVAVLHYRKLSLDWYHEIEVPNLAVYRVSFNDDIDGRVERLK